MLRTLLYRTAALLLCLTSATWAQFESSGTTYAASDARPGAKPWDLSIRAFIGHMDNVQTVPDSTFFAGESADSYAQSRSIYLQNRRFELEGATGVETDPYTESYIDPYAPE